MYGGIYAHCGGTFLLGNAYEVRCNTDEIADVFKEFWDVFRSAKSWAT